MKGRHRSNKHGRTLRHTMALVTLSKPRLPAGTKTDRILGYRRRTKLSPSKFWTPEDEGKEPSGAQRQSLSSDAPQSPEPVKKRSKIGNMFIDPLSAQIPFRGRKDPASSSGIVLPPSLENGSVSQGHSRTRTSLSQLLNDTISSPLNGEAKLDNAKSKAQATSCKAKDPAEVKPHATAAQKPLAITETTPYASPAAKTPKAEHELIAQAPTPNA